MHVFHTLLAALATASSASALGINCRGSFMCSYDKKGAIDTLLAQLRTGDPNESYGDGQQIVCQESQICVFYQNTGRQWTRAQTRDFVQGLIGHDCQACGSIPVDEGNNVDNGQLTINYVGELQGRSAPEFTTKVRRTPDLAPTEPQIETKRSEEQPTAETPTVHSVRFTPRDTPKSQLAKRLGINCRGSGVCAVALDWFPIASLQDLRDKFAAGGDGSWHDGEHLICVPHQSSRVCAFYQNVGDRSFDKGQSLGYLDSILSHGCTVCGSVPTDDGNNVDNGQLTVNYVA